MKGKKKRRSVEAKKEQKPPASQDNMQTEADNGQPPARTQAPIRKGIYLSALIYIEGEQPPAENFDPVAIGALREVLSSAFTKEHNGLKMSLKTIDVRNDIEQEDKEQEDKAKQGKEEKFQF